MAKSPHYKGNNKGGYGNPPIDGQFNGQPGPGRPKGKRSITAALKKALNEPMVVTGKNGERRKIDPIDAIARRAVQLGLIGKARDNERAIALAEKYGPEGSLAPTQQDLTRLSEAELELYGYLAARLEGIPFEEIGPQYREPFEEIAGFLGAIHTCERDELQALGNCYTDEPDDQ